MTRFASCTWYKRKPVLKPLRRMLIKITLKLKINKQIEIGGYWSLSIWHYRGKYQYQNWVPMKNRTSDFRIPRSDALPLSHRDSTLSEVCDHYPVFMVPCWEWILQIKNRHKRERPQTLLIVSRNLWRQTLDVQLKCKQLNNETTSYKGFFFFPSKHEMYFINPSAFRMLDASINVHIITYTLI